MGHLQHEPSVHCPVKWQRLYLKGTQESWLIVEKGYSALVALGRNGSISVVISKVIVNLL